MTEERRVMGIRRRRTIYMATTYGMAVVIVVGGVLIYVFTNQALSSYLVGLAGLVVAAIGLLLAYKVNDSQAANSTSEPLTQVQSNLQVDNVRDSEITGIDTVSRNPQHLSSRMRLGKVIGSKITGVHVRRQ